MTEALNVELMTAEEYLKFDDASPYKHEFYYGRVYRMYDDNGLLITKCVGRHHHEIRMNVIGKLHDLLRDLPLKWFMKGMCVFSDNELGYSSPEVVIAGQKLVFDAVKGCLLTNPTVIIDILSDFTEQTDRTTKLLDYKQIPSLQQYVLIAQDETRAELFTRQGDLWVHTEVLGLDATLTLESIPVSVAMADVYAGVEFPEPKALGDDER